ncbi:MAG TPA: glucosamine-6-phosphate deaminase [Thermoanaerobaculia bacterium]|nr:glucosamine-6-phosphate deaminase [Thermoanaerobaculia bacterium]
MKWETFPDYESLSARAAELFLDAIRRDPRVVLGLPTGRTPIGMYGRVVAECSREYRCFSEVTTFNLDEYAGIPREHPGSYCTFMRRQLFDHVDIDLHRVHIPDGLAPDLATECERYEAAIRAAGGLGVTFLGLGSNGHIAFNEPGTPFDSRTRVVTLTESTRAANAAVFGADVPTHAITIGIGTIIDSASVVLLATGTNKRAAIDRLRSGEVSVDFPASALWRHEDVTVLAT